MLTQEQRDELKAHLERAQNPLFFYDNDADGLCSFLILRRYIGRGKGVAVRSYPDLNVQYARKVEEFKADYIFILDKPSISNEFLEEINKLALPVVWIDHHNLGDTKSCDNLYVYNPSKNEGKYRSDEPVTNIVYEITNRKEDMWIALIGCISDHFMPHFYSDFVKMYPDFASKGLKEAFDVYFRSEIGRIARAFNFGLKDSVTNVVHMQNFLLNCQSPSDVFSEVNLNSSFRKKYFEIKKKYDSLLVKAKKNVSGKVLFFEYSGDLSISSELSNELCYFYPEKTVLVAYKKGSITNISIRGKGVKKILEKVIGKFDGASGGGHEDAVGARIKTSDLELFKSELENEVV